jgi:hypothetical protein
VKRSWFIILMCAFATVTLVAQEPSTTKAETTAAVAAKGQMLLSSNGARLGTVNRVTADGSAQIIIDGKLVTVPAATLSTVNGKLTTSLSKNEVLALP